MNFAGMLPLPTKLRLQKFIPVPLYRFYTAFTIPKAQLATQ